MGVYRRVLAAAAAASGLAVAFAAAPHAAGLGSAPRILDAHFLSSPVAGRTAILQVRADSAERPVSGIVVAFADGLFGESACQIDSSGKSPGAPFGPGDTARFNIEHIFTKAGTQPIAVRVDDGGCAGGGGSVLQPFTVTPTEPGAPTTPASPLLPGTPIVTLPQIPGTTPVAPTVPSIPGLPSLPLPPSTPGEPIVIPGTTTPGATTPAVTLPGVTVPGTTVPGTTVPGVTVPGVTVPGVTVPGVTIPGVTATVPTLPAVPPLPLKHAAGALTGKVRKAPAVKPCKGWGTAAASKKTIALARRATLCLINRERTRRGLRALRTDRRLSRAATAYSKLMVKSGFFAHVSPSGTKVVDRVRKQQYLPRFGKWRIGENIGMGERVLGTPRALVRAWMASTGHRANILDKGFRQIGLGIASGTPGKASDRGATYTTDFGAVE